MKVGETMLQRPMTIMLTLCLVLGLSPTVMAVTGLEWRTLPEEAKMGYVMGFLDLYVRLKVLGTSGLKDSITGTTLWEPDCAIHAFTYEQFDVMTRKYMERHPEDLRWFVSTIMLLAINEVCHR